MSFWAALVTAIVFLTGVANGAISVWLYFRWSRLFDELQQDRVALEHEKRAWMQTANSLYARHYET